MNDMFRWKNLLLSSRNRKKSQICTDKIIQYSNYYYKETYIAALQNVIILFTTASSSTYRLTNLLLLTLICLWGHRNGINVLSYI